MHTKETDAPILNADNKDLLNGCYFIEKYYKTFNKDV